MHREARAFVSDVVKAIGPHPQVVEVGSRNINGGVRDLFIRDAATYWGIDLWMGKGVDLVADAATWRPPVPADVVVCCEVLEHAPEAPAIVVNLGQMLKPGGYVILTCATDPRPPHSGHDGGALRDGEFYHNIDPELLQGWLGERFDLEMFEIHPKRGDLYVLAQRR